MAIPRIEAERRAWRAAFDPRAPLEDQLRWPFVPAWQIAHVTGLSESTVYAHGAQFDAYMRLGQYAEAARFIPCIVSGRSKRFPTRAFIRHWESAGGATLRALAADAAREAASA